jgi:GDP-L-fucose synthase
MLKTSRIFIAGHNGLVGGAILRALSAQGHNQLLTRSRAELDLLDQRAVKDFFYATRPEYVFVAAAKVGGIYANSTFPADFIYQNLQIQNNLIHSAYSSGVRKLLFLGSSCIYPKFAPQPLKEEYLLSSSLEPTNEPYAIAKIAGIKMCESYRRQYGCDFVSAMPTNIYGPGDNYHAQNSHVIPALLRRFHEAKAENMKSVVCWGTGSARREFLFSEDLADACIFLMRHYSEAQFVNVGVGADLSIRELAETVANVVGFGGDIEWDLTKPDGTPRKLLDVELLSRLGWRAKTPLREGLQVAYQDFLARTSQPDVRLVA